MMQVPEVVHVAAYYNAERLTALCEQRLAQELSDPGFDEEGGGGGGSDDGGGRGGGGASTSASGGSANGSAGAWRRKADQERLRGSPSRAQVDEVAAQLLALAHNNGLSQLQTVALGYIAGQQRMAFLWLRPRLIKKHLQTKHRS